MRTKLGPILAVLVTLFVALVAPPALAAYITVHGGPTYTPGIGGFQVSSGGGDVTGVNDAGTVVGSAFKYDSSGANLALRAVRWDGSGAAAVELGSLGTVFGGSTESKAAAINNSGTVVGKSHLYFGFDLGERAVRWNSYDAAVSMLDQLSTASTAATVRFISEALAINDAGAAVGSAYKVLGMGASFGDYKGTRAVRWSASSTAVTELGNLGTDSSGVTYATAYAINAAGAAVGSANKFTGSGADRGYRAVRWNSGGTAAIELGNLGTDPSGSTYNEANAVNNAGTAVGDALKYGASGMYLGSRAVRWNAGGTVATELGHLGTDLSGFTAASALAINSSGTAIGSASKFDASGIALGERAVRWDASGTAATELGNLPGYTRTSTDDINEAGIAVGSLQKYDSGMLLEAKAVYWGFDALPVDLNTLIDPASGWTLNRATRISDTGWIGGGGTFDPDGPGGQAAYERLFLMHVPATAVPEPATAVHFGVALAAMFGSLSQRSNSRRTARRANHRHAVRRPSFEPLEDRCLLSFSPAISYPVGSSPQVMAAGDFNNDGHLDLATVNYDANADVSTVSVLLGDGRGGFGAATIGPASNPLGGAKPVSLAVADFNNDGYRDLAVVASYRNPETMETYGSLNLLLGNGNGIFQPPARPGYAAPLAVAAGDFNNDGKSDLVVSEIDLGWGNAQVYAQLGNGHGGFTPPGQQGWTLLPYPLGAATVADLNRDGNLDVVLWAPGGSTGYALLGNGHGSFSYNFYNSEFPTGADVRGLAVGDFTGDGIPDLISAGETVDVLRRHGDGSFDAPINQTANGAMHTGVAVADFNGDGKLDATTSDADTGTVSLMMGNGNGSLTYVGAYPVGASPSAIAVADFNGDGRPDVAAANGGSNTVSVLLNDGNWPATSPTLPGDYNGNGAVDTADYIVWRKMLGSSVTNFSGADGSGNGVVDQDDQAIWRAHFGQTLPAVGAGSLVVAANAANPELSASMESVEVTEHASASVEPAEPDERGSIEPQGTSARNGALAVFDSWLPQFDQQGKATMRRLRALPITDSGTKAPGTDLLLVRSSAAQFDHQPSKHGLNSRLINDSTEEAMETRREALDIAFTTLEHAARQLGGNMLRKVWAGLCAGLVTLALQSSCAASATIYNLGTLGGSYSHAADLNEAGQVVGYAAMANGSSHAFLRDNGTMIDLGTLRGTESYARGINDLGQVVGVSDGHAFLITPQGGVWFRDSNHDGRNDLMIDFMPALGGSTRGSWISDINNAGQVVGEYNVSSEWFDGSSDQAFVWDAAHGMTNLGMLLSGFTDSYATGINEAGQVTGYASYYNDYDPDDPLNGWHSSFLWDAAHGMTVLGAGDNYTDSMAAGINDVGQLVGSQWNASAGPTLVFLWTSDSPNELTGSFADLGALPGATYSSATAINTKGQVAGYSETTGGAQHAFLYTGMPGVDGHKIDLDAWLDANNPIEGAKWTLASAAGVTDTGLISGEGNYNDGPGGLTDGTRAFVLDASALVSTSLSGDYNHDGKIDAADYVVWRKSDGSQSGYNTWRSHFGQTAGSGAALPSVESLSAAVPEPSTFLLLLLAPAGICNRRHRPNR